VVTATGGVPPFMYSLNNGAFQSSNVIAGISAGTYPVVVQDSRGCTTQFDVTVGAQGSTLSATANTSADSECFAPHNGSITVIPAGGTPPYDIKFGAGAFGTSTSFTELEQGSYTVIVRDTESCTVTLAITVPHGDTGISYSTEIQPIIATRCAVSGCHVAGTSVPNFSSYSGVQSRAQNIKLRTTSGSMPPAGNPDLTAQQIQLIACWVDDGAKNN